MIVLPAVWFALPGLGLVGRGMSASQQAVPAATPAYTPSELAKQVDQHYDRLHSLSVHFTETYHGMGMQRAESGILLLQKPGRMRWNYTDPLGKVFVIGGHYGYSYTPGDAQAERYPAKQLEDFRSPLRFLLGHTRIEKELTNQTLRQNGAEFLLRGVPKGMEQRVAEVELTVTSNGEIQAIQWREVDGAITSFRLTNEQPNPPLVAATFSFVPPAGVVVVNGLAPM